ncbi:hypothetical protein OSTOST_05538, partial [Ostertagia ostertagi]
MSARGGDPSPSPSTSSSFTGLKYVSILDDRTRMIPAEKLGYGACRSVNEFVKLNRIGEGTYGIVYRARDSKSGQVVALKKVRVDSKMSAQMGISDSALREIVLLKKLRHENIVELKEVAVSRDPQGMFLVMEYCEQDLAKLLDEMVHPFTEPQIDKIIGLLGTPTTKIWAELDSMPLLENFTLKTQPFNNVKVVFESASPLAVDLLNALFTYDPKKRISAAAALAHPFFTVRQLVHLPFYCSKCKQ